MIRNYKDLLPPIVAILVIAAITFVFWMLEEDQYTSVEAVTNAEYTVNDGKSLRKVNHSIITDMDSGMQYIYFEGYGVSPLITEDGEFSKTVE